MTIIVLIWLSVQFWASLRGGFKHVRLHSQNCETPVSRLAHLHFGRLSIRSFPVWWVAAGPGRAESRHYLSMLGRGMRPGRRPSVTVERWSWLPSRSRRFLFWGSGVWDSSAVHLVFFVCLRSCNNSQWLVNGPSFAPPLMNIKQHGKSETSARRGREICQNIRGVDRQKNTWWERMGNMHDGSDSEFRSTLYCRSSSRP